MSQLDPGKLNDKQEQFCLEYCKDFNKTQACIRAGYESTSAFSYAIELYSQDKVRNRIREILRERRAEYPHTIERMQQEIQRLAFMDIGRIIKQLTEGGRITVESLRDLPPTVTATIKAVTSYKDGSVKLEFWDKVAALDMLAKHFGFFEEDNKQKQADGPLVYIPENGRALNSARAN
jgi:phage terminase small subunit